MALTFRIAAVLLLPVLLEAQPGSTVREATWSGPKYEELTGGSPWPLTVPEGRIVCDPGPWTAVFVQTRDGRTWPLNGIANNRAADLGFEPNPRPIWKDHPVVDGAKVSLSGLIEYALRSCGYVRS